jgi:aminopeptidase N
VATCVVVFLAFPATGHATIAGPGAPSVGDEYFPADGNTGYTVSHYDIRLRYQPATDELTGTTTIVAAPTQDLTTFTVDFALKTTSVRVNGAPARFQRNGKKLEVTPSQRLASGSLLTTVVDYQDVPSRVLVDGEVAWKRTPDGALAVGEPHICVWWFPCNDHPQSKATYDISVAVPDGTDVLSNGVLTGKSSQRGWTRSDWQSVKPQTTYLAFLAIGHYDVITRTGFGGAPFITAYGKDIGADLGAAMASVERTPEVIEFESGLFGPYPFEAQGGVVPSTGLGFALETQTRPIYSSKFFTRGANMYVVVHENAHEWFGDAVSVHKWRNIWLNEGFASYAEWLWSEAKGEGTAQELFDVEYAQRPADDPAWQVEPGDPGVAKLFDGFGVYTRGAMTLHALRTTVGDDIFKKILQRWVSAKLYATATIEQFIDLAIRVSGKDLHPLFTAWLFTGAKPAVSASTGVAVSAARDADEVPAPSSLEKIHDVRRVTGR